MPYIKPTERPPIKDLIQCLDLALQESTLSDEVGKINYAVSLLLQLIVKRHGLRYHTLNAIMGVLACIQEEFYRKVVVPYEEKKIKENGLVGIMDIADDQQASSNS
jgi:hypothetical protein